MYDGDEPVVERYTYKNFKDNSVSNREPVITILQAWLFLIRTKVIFLDSNTEYNNKKWCMSSLYSNTLRLT